VTDLLNTRWADLLALNQTNRVWTKRESKTGKIRRVIANDAIFEAIAKWQMTYQLEPPEPSEFIFVGQRGRICPATVTMWVKGWTKQISLPGRFGGRSLRQTWAYQQIQAGQSLPLIMKMLGHSSEAITLRYVGITDVQEEEAYKGVCL
jgi:integrase